MVKIIYLWKLNLLKFSCYTQWTDTTIVQEIFGIKKFSDVQWCLKIKYSKYVLQQNIYSQKKIVQMCTHATPSAIAIKKVRHVA